MKNLFFAAFQFVLFFIAFLAFSLFPPLHIERVVSHTATVTRTFIWDGLLISFALAVLVLVIEAMRGRIRKAGPCTAAFRSLSTLIGLWQSFGFKTVGR